MLSYYDVVSSRCAAALTKIQVGIEQFALTALMELGVDRKTLEAAADSLNQACQAHGEAEREAYRIEEQYRRFQQLGLHPFDANVWKASCLTQLQALLGDKHLRGFALTHYQLWARHLYFQLPSEDAMSAMAVSFDASMEALGVAPFDAVKFEKACVHASRAGAQGCGQSDEVWTRNVTRYINEMLHLVPPEHLDVATKFAREVGWESAEERAAAQQELEDEGCCSHGFDPDCCPCGCGDL